MVTHILVPVKAKAPPSSLVFNDAINNLAVSFGQKRSSTIGVTRSQHNVHGMFGGNRSLLLGVGVFQKTSAKDIP